MNKKQLFAIFKKYEEKMYYSGSCGELGDSIQAVDSDCYSDIIDSILKLNESKDNFEKAVKPAIRYLLRNHHPHTKILIDYSNAEL